MRGSTAGISDGLRGTSRAHSALLVILDSLLSALFISPLVVAYWRGTWGLMDHFVFPQNHAASAQVSLVLGLAGVVSFTALQGLAASRLQPAKRWLSYYTTSRLYTALFGFVCVNSWRGAWMALDVYTSMDPRVIAAITLVSLLALLFSRTVRNISAPPFAIITDRYEGYFDVPTLFKSSTESVWIYLVDCVFSVCVVGSLVVFVWRGTWVLLDMFLYPGDLHSSALASVVVGYGIVGITFALQPPMKYLAKKLSGGSRIIVVDIYLLFSFCGTVNVWRGIWSLLNLYLLPEFPAGSAGITHAVSFLLLVLINASNSVLVRGVYIDGEESGAQCVDFPCYYLRLFYQTKRKKKLLRQAEKRQSVRSRSEGEGLIQVGVMPIVEPDWKKSANHSHTEILPH